MDTAGTFFVAILFTQLGFTGAMVWLVARRFPRRAALYRFVAPAAVPVLLATLAILSYVATMRSAGAVPEPMVIGRLALAYAVLWLAGILFASLVIRWTGRRR